MNRITGLLLTAALAAAAATPQPLRAADNDCARLFAALAGAKAEPPPKKKADDFSPEEVRRVLTERPCLKHFPWPKGEFLVDEGTKKGVSAERMGEIAAAVRRTCAAWAKDKAALERAAIDQPAQERLTVAMLREGTDPDHLALYADLLHALKLRNERQTAKLIEAVEAVRRHDPLRVEAAPRDEFEDSTYFTKPTLRCMLALLDYGAKAEALRDDPVKLLQAATGLLDDWPVLQFHTGLAGDPKERLLAAVGALRPKLAESFQTGGDHWKHTAALESHPAVAGVLTTGGSWVLYLRGRENRLYPLAVAPSGRTTLLSPEQAANAFTAHALREIREHSTPAMKLFLVLPGPEGYSVTFPDGDPFSLSRADYDRLRNGEKLPADHALAAALAVAREGSLVLYTHPLMHKAGPELAASRDLTFALQRAYPGMRVHRDPLSPRTAERAKKLDGHAVGGLGDLLVLVADDSFKVPQNATVKNIKDDLAAQGLAPLTFAGQKYEGPAGRTVIVITGHTSEQLKKYVRELGEAGYFKDNFVVFNSCEAPLTEQLLTEMTARYGAAGAFAHEKKIGIDDVQQVVLDLVKKVKATGGLNLFKLLIETLHRNNLNGVWSICRLGNPAPCAGKAPA